MKKRVIISSILAILFLGIICISIYYSNYQYKTGYNLTTEQKQTNIEKLVSKQDYSGAKTLSQNYYYTDNDLEEYNRYSSLIIVCKNHNLTSFKDADEQSKKNKKESDEKSKDNKLFNAIGDEIKNIGVNNMTKEQYISYINRYMDYVLNGGSKRNEAIVNLSNLKDNYSKLFFTLSEVDYMGNNAIKSINPNIGMTEMEVKALTKYSNPKRINKTETKYGVRKQYCFLNDYLYFEDGKLTSIQS